MRISEVIAFRMNGGAGLSAFLDGDHVWPAAPLEATGGHVWNINGYRVHAFYASGTFEVTSIPEGASDQVEYLIVGGGGSGGQGGGGAGGGGGGGGVLTGTTTVTATTFPVVVGAGGAVNNQTGNTRGYPGGNSSFAGLTALGGGGGGRVIAGGAGSSGGGGGPGQAGGAGTVGQGYDGTAGVSTGSSPNRTFAGGGGGGASSAAGTANVAVSGGDGGAEVISTITGRAIGYAGGGGGASGRDASGAEIDGGAAGGTSGARGARSHTALPASAYRGGGGGGGGFNAATGSAGAAGGSGVVVIRYPHTAAPSDYIEPDQPSGWESLNSVLRVSNETTIIQYASTARRYVFTPYGCVASDGSLLLAYRSGTAHHSAGRTEIIRGQHRPYLWETPAWANTPHVTIDPPSGYDDVRDAKLLTLPNGNILIAYCVQDSLNLDDSHARVRISTDNGETFGAEIDPNDDVPAWTGKLVPQGPEVRDDGSILLPVWGTVTPAASTDTMAIWRSTDGGSTWAHYADLGAGQEPELVRGDSASEWLLFFRGGAKRSTDDGATWATLTTTLTVNNWVKPVRSPLTGNLLACIRNGVGGPPAVVMSTDDGATWSSPLASDSGSGVQLGAYIFTDSSGGHKLIHAVEPGGTAVKSSLLQELTP